MCKYDATCVLQGWISQSGGYWWTLRRATMADIVRYAGNPRWRIVNVNKGNPHV